MTTATIYSPENAPESSAPILRDLDQTLGFVPNVFGVLAGSPSALTAFATLNAQFAGSTLSVTEREVIQLTVSAQNHCGYCVAGHTAFAAMQGVDEAIVTAVRNGAPIADQRLETLRRFTSALLQRQGMVTEAEIEQFLAAGYTRQQLLEVILGVCVKVFSNLTSNAIGLPLDDAFMPYAWHEDATSIVNIQRAAA